MSDELTGIDLIAATEAKHAVEWLPSTSSIEDKLRAAMKVTKNHWLLSQLGQNEGRCMRAAVAGVLMSIGVDSEDGKRIATEHRALGKFGAALEAVQAGVPVDFASLVEQDEFKEENLKPVGLLALWKEASNG